MEVRSRTLLDLQWSFIVKQRDHIATRKWRYVFLIQKHGDFSFLEQDVPNVNFIAKLDLKHKIADNVFKLICAIKFNSPILFLCCCKTVLAYGKMLSWLLYNHWAYKTFSS